MPLPISPTILLAAASFILLCGRVSHVRVRWICGFYFVIVILLAMSVLTWEPNLMLDATDEVKVRRVWKIDGLARCEQWLVLGFGLMTGIAMFNSPRREQDIPNSYGFLLFALAGLMLVAGSNDFLSMGLSLELVSLAVMALRTRLDSDLDLRSSNPIPITVNRLRAKDHWFGWFTSGWMWLGIAILSTATATTHFDVLRLVLTDSYDSDLNQTPIGTPSKLILLAVGLIVMSLFSRMGLVPFHLSFCPGFRGGYSDSNGFAILAGQLGGSVALTRLFGCVFVSLGQSLIILTMTVTLLTFVLSSVLVVRGLAPGLRSIPPWIASLMLFQSGWLAIGLMIATVELEHPGLRWGAFAHQDETLALIVFTQLANLLASCAIFWTLGHLTRTDREVEFLEDFKGLGKLAPTASVALILGLATIIGCPFTAGFWGRWMTILAGHSVHTKSNSAIFVPHDGLRFTMLAGTIATPVIAVIVIRIAREMFLESPLARPAAIGGRGSLIASSIAAFTSLLLGIAPNLVLVPLRTIQSPRLIKHADPERGSGKNSFGSTNEIKVSSPHRY